MTNTERNKKYIAYQLTQMYYYTEIVT